MSGASFGTGLTLDLLDFSPEEIRLEAYNANAEGKPDSYVRIALVYI